MLRISKFTENVDYELIVQDKHLIVICNGRGTTEINRVYLDKNLRINTLKSGKSMTGLSIANGDIGLKLDILKASKLQITISSNDNKSVVRDGNLLQMRIITNKLPQTAYANNLLEELFDLVQESIGL
jgi:hypothetical protein